MTDTLDRRLHAYRPDLADSRLRGKVEAARFVDGVPARIAAPLAPLKRVPRSDASLDSELICGESVLVFDEAAEGWSFVQNDSDGYVGYVPTDALGPILPEPTHRVSALRTFIYPGPDMKVPALDALSLGARVTIAREAETRGTRYGLLAGGRGAVVTAHLDPADAPPEPDFVAVAERFTGLPYLWGGRSSLGLDCSALVQLSLAAAGHRAPRDTDMQENALGRAVEGGRSGRLRRGDLVFWRGHVGIMIDGEYLVHASGHHMTVVIEPLAEAVSRISARGSEVSSVRRL